VNKAIAVLAVAGLLAFGLLWSNSQLRLERFEAAIFRALQEQHPSLTRVDARLLRDGPTVTGVAVPKYYLWARLFSKGTEFDGVAVRIADDTGGVEVLQAVSRGEIRRDSATLHNIFPAVLVPIIVELANDTDRLP